MFRPETVEEMISLLERVKSYCMMKEEAENQKILEMSQERSSFVAFIKKISQIVDCQSRESIKETLKDHDKLKVYTRIF